MPTPEAVVGALEYCLFGKFPPSRVLVGFDGIAGGPLASFLLPDSVLDLVKRYLSPY
jgi:hypothetical protein